MTKFTIEDSKNYAAQVVRLPEPFALPKLDRLVGVGVFGVTVLVTRDWAEREGQLAVFFPAESQLSEKLAHEACLYRDAGLNADPDQTGYFEKSRRVKATKFRGTVSGGFLMPVEEVASIFNVPPSGFVENLTFDHIDGQKVCEKYRLKPEREQGVREKGKLRHAFRRVDNALFPEHIETDQYQRNEHVLDDDDFFIVTQKLHGTSFRIGRVPVRRKQTWRDRIAAWLRIPTPDTELDVVYGSRHSIKDVNNPDQAHFYDTDLWTEFGKTIADRIPAGVIVYGELIGWADVVTPIQQGHTYDLAAGDRDLYVYRVAVISAGGDMYDLHWDAVRAFCRNHGLKHVPELWRGPKHAFRIDDYKEKDFHRASFSENYPDKPVSLSKGGTGVDEGIAIRIDRGQQVPLLFKMKNDSHYLFETAQLDAEAVDIEADA